MPQPQPSNLDHGRSQPRIAGLGDALLPMDRSALPRRGGQSGVGGNLLSVAEPAEQALRPERGGRLGSNAFQRQQLGRWRWHAGARLRVGQQGIPLGFDSLDLFDQELEPIELPADLGLQALWKGAAIARDQLLKPLPAVSVQGLVVADPLGEQKPLDAVDVLDPFGCQRLALPTDPAAVLLLGRRSPSSPASWMTMMGKTCPVRARAFSLSWDKRARRAAMSPLGTACLDIFSPPPGAREVMTQVE